MNLTCCVPGLSLTLSGLAFAQSSSSAFDADAFDAYVTRAVTDWEVPGLAIAVIKDDNVIFARNRPEHRPGS